MNILKYYEEYNKSLKNIRDQEVILEEKFYLITRVRFSICFILYREFLEALVSNIDDKKHNSMVFMFKGNEVILKDKGDYKLSTANYIRKIFEREVYEKN